MTLLDTAGLEGPSWDGEHGGAIVLQALRLRLWLAPASPMEISQAAGLEMGVQLGEGGEGRHGNHEVPPPIAHQVLHVALLVAPPDPAEPMGEEEVALQAQELSGELPLARPHHLLHRDGRV